MTDHMRDVAQPPFTSWGQFCSRCGGKDAHCYICGIRRVTIEECAKAVETDKVLGRAMGELAANVIRSLTAQEAPAVLDGFAAQPPAAPVETEGYTAALLKIAGAISQLQLAEKSTSDEVTRRHLREILSQLSSETPVSRSSAESGGAEEAIRDWWYSGRRQTMTSKGAAQSLIWHLAKCGMKIIRDEPQAAPVLDWLATKTNYELSFDGWNEDPTWNVHSVNGGRNDREWTLLATGSTPEEALRKAMSLSLSRPHEQGAE